MKEIKAYIRCSKVELVITALRTIGIENLTVVDVMALGKGMIDPDKYKYSIECVEKYSDVAKMEIVCTDEVVASAMETIRKHAYTGERGDGLILVSDVEQTLKIRSGARGVEAL
ncbi:MAG: P-II family nitrogen regulator [Fidelibacterota bacterium]